MIIPDKRVRPVSIDHLKTSEDYEIPPENKRVS